MKKVILKFCKSDITIRQTCRKFKKTQKLEIQKIKRMNDGE